MSEPFIDVKDEATAKWALQQYYSRLPTSPVLLDGYRDASMRIVDIYKAKKKQVPVTTTDYSKTFVDTVEEPAKEYAEDIIDRIEGTQRAYTVRTPLRIPRRREIPTPTDYSKHVVDTVEEPAKEFGEATIEKIESTKVVYREPPKPRPPPSLVRETRPYETTIDAIGDVEREFGEKTIEKYGHYTQAPIVTKDIGEMTVEKGVELREKSVETLAEGKPWEGLGQYLTGVALTGGVSFVRGATSIVNPFAWARSIQDVHYLASTPEAQKQLRDIVARDPFSFTVDVGAGIAGGYAGGRLIGGLYTRHKEIKLQEFYEEFPEELFYAEDGIPDPAFPHPTDVERSTFTGFDKKRVKIDYEAGRTEGIYYDLGPLDEGVKPSRITDIPDEGLAVTEVIKPKKGLIYQLGDEYGLVQTGHDLVPAILPEGVGRFETIYVPRLWKEYGTGHLPGVTSLPPYFDSALALSISPLANILPIAGATSGLLTGVPSIDEPLPDTKTTVIQDTTPPIDDTGLDEIPKIIEMVDEIYKPKPAPTPPITIPKPDPIIKPVPEPPFVTPIIDPILEEDTDITTITIQDIFQEQKPFQEQKQEQIIPHIPRPIDFFDSPEPYRPRLPRIPPRKTRRAKRPATYDPFGWEMRVYPGPEVEDILGIDFSEKKKKKKKTTRKKKSKTKRKRKKK